MQTFLPFASYKASAISLDYRRLGKQRVEVKQIFNSIVTNSGWNHHPVCRMWRGHEYHLLLYGVEICKEWRERGYNDSLLPQFLSALSQFSALPGTVDTGPPKWLGEDYFHQTHRSNLIRKLSSHYRDQLGWIDPSNLPYYWPNP